MTEAAPKDDSRHTTKPCSQEHWVLSVQDGSVFRMVLSVQAAQDVVGIVSVQEACSAPRS